MKITIEQLESLAADLIAAAEANRGKLHRLITAYARIINLKSPEAFTRRATEWSDEDGHWDNSYPPKQEYKERTGPRTIRIINIDRESKATSGGFYHDTEWYTTDGGLSVGPDGTLWAGDLHGTGEYGQFAAHPGDCNVRCEIDYSELDLADVPLDRLIKAEKELRDLAFPLMGATYELQLA